MGRFATMDTLVRAIETGSLSAAARQLQVGQPAVSKTIAQLEAKLGTKLLLRTTHKLTPTEAGRRFYKHAKLAIEEVDEAERAARGAGAGLTGRLLVCAPVTFGGLHLIPRLPSFMQKHPGLDIQVVMDDRNIDLLKSGIDIALRAGPMRDSSLIARKISSCRRLVVGTPGYFAKAGVPLMPSDLAEHQAVIMQLPGHGATWTFRRGTSQVSATVQGRLRVTAGEGLRAGVLADLGLAVTSEWAFARELAERTVEPVLCDWLLPPLDLWAVFPAGRRSSAKVRAFVDFIESELSKSETATAAAAREIVST
jgi:DNA-binding transcriptional LysR family regulator